MTNDNDERLITAVFCGTATGDFLPVQIIYKGKTQRCHPRFAFPSGWHVTHSANHWSTEETMLQYVDHIILPYVEKTRELCGDDTSALVIMDNFKVQITESLFSLLDSHNILVCLLPLTQLIDSNPWTFLLISWQRTTSGSSSVSGTRSKF